MKALPKDLRYLLFDLDGTLTDSAEGILRCVQYALEQCGTPEPDAEKLRPFIGPPLLDSFQEFCGMPPARAAFAVEQYRKRFSTVGLLENAVYDGIPELLEKLREGRSLSSSDVWERLAATVACKAAIKGGWVTEQEELLALAEKVLAGEVTHCPHGRPVMTVFTRAELDKRFGRIV